MSASSSFRFIDPTTLARISNLQLLAKKVVEGFTSGLHRSPFLGRTMDFAEYRAYQPGDDIRQIDWKLFSRSDRFYVKQYEGDTNTNLVLVLDVSRSMDFATAAMSKLDYGKALCACLAVLATRQRDRLGFAAVDSGVREWLPPAARAAQRTVEVISRAAVGGTSDLPAALRQVAERLRRRGFVAVVSDFYHPAEQTLRSLALLQSRGADVLAFHVLDPAELSLPFGEPIDLVDLEGGERVSLVPEGIREQYNELIKKHIAALEKGCSQIGIDYCLVDTGQPLDAALHAFLSRRLWAQKSR